MTKHLWKLLQLTFNSARRILRRNWILSALCLSSYLSNTTPGIGSPSGPVEVREKAVFPILLPGNFLETRIGAHISLSLRYERLVCPAFRFFEYPESNSSIRNSAYSTSFCKIEEHSCIKQIGAQEVLQDVVYQIIHTLFHLLFRNFNITWILFDSLTMFRICSSLAVSDRCNRCLSLLALSSSLPTISDVEFIEWD